MKSADIVSLLQSDPGAESLLIARNWLESKKHATKTTTCVALAVLRASTDDETLKWLTDWVLDKDWSLAYYAYREINSRDVENWVFRLLCDHPANPQCAELWAGVLASGPVSEELRENATRWFLSHEKCDKYVARAASSLVRVSQDKRVWDKAQALVEKAPYPEILVAELVEHVGDERSKRLARELLFKLDPNDVLFVADALMKVGETADVALWLKNNRKNKYFHAFLCFLMKHDDGTLIRIAFKWLEKNQKLKAPTLPFITAQALRPSQQLVDDIWEWVRSHRDSPHAPYMLALVFNHFEELETPAPAIDYAEKWLTKNKNHECAPSILIGVIQYRDTVQMRDLAIQVLDSIRKSEQGMTLLNLIRGSRCPKIFERADRWAEKNYDPEIADVIRATLAQRRSSST